MSDPTVLRCRLGWLPTVEWAGLFVADAAGWFDDRGLQLELLPGGPGCVGAAGAVAVGDADVGIASDLLAVVDVIADGSDLCILAATMHTSPLGIAMLGSGGPLTMESLRGRRIGAGTSADQAVLDALFRGADLEPDYEFVSIGGGVDELLSGAADAICCSTISQPPAAERRGIRLRTATFAELGLPMPADVVVARRSTVARRRDDITRFLRGLRDGWDAVLDDPANGARISHQRHGRALGRTLEDEMDENMRQLPLIAPTTDGTRLLWIDVHALDDSLRRLGRHHHRPLPAAHDLVDLAPLVEASDPETVGG